jgi:hypothetical protein
VWPDPTSYVIAQVSTHLCCCSLLLPYGQLLGRLWHSSTSPTGMLLAVDAEAPRLVARSIYYKTLNGGPFCHDVFAVELPGPQVSAARPACAALMQAHVQGRISYLYHLLAACAALWATHEYASALPQHVCMPGQMTALCVACGRHMVLLCLCLLPAEQGCGDVLA